MKAPCPGPFCTAPQRIRQWTTTRPGDSWPESRQTRLCRPCAAERAEIVASNLGLVLGVDVGVMRNPTPTSER
jgi:hypothetical protein